MGPSVGLHIESAAGSHAAGRGGSASRTTEVGGEADCAREVAWALACGSINTVLGTTRISLGPFVWSRGATNKLLNDDYLISPA